MNKKGFTLLELLVVVLIIGILAGIALPQYKKAVLRSKFATIKNKTRAIYDAEQRYYLANNQYTTNWNDLDITIKNVSADCNISLPDSYVYCFANKQNGEHIMKYVLIPPNKQIRCDAYPADQNHFTNKLCQEEMGKQTPHKCFTESNKNYCIYL